MIDELSISARLEAAIAARRHLFEPRHEAAFRLFNGFREGWAEVAIDLYGRTLVIHDYSGDDEAIRLIAAVCRRELPWIGAMLRKTRGAEEAGARRGRWLDETAPDRRVREDGVWYALDLQTNRDAGLYLDTRLLRMWAHRNLGGRRVLNTFAYTGSLGVAAMAGGATRVVHLDLKREFLNIAKTSYTLNGFPIDRSDFVTADFWPAVSRLIRAGEQFDCVFLDPPIFATTRHGVVDVERNYARLVNKVRPLIADNGRLVAVNNGVYVSGAEYQATLESLCVDGYLQIEELIPVGEDFTLGDAPPIVDPAPFNHSTKIAVLRVKRK